MPHERLRLEQLLQDASGRADSESAKPADIRQAMIHSWNVLSTAGYTRFGSVAALRPADFAARIKATEPDMSRPISMALDVIARHQFNHLEGAPDKSVQFLQRAHLLSPDDVRIACHFADVTILLQDEHLSRIADPNIRTTTLRGYRSTAQDAILQTLKNQFGITEGIVRGSSPTTIESCVEHQSQEHKDHAYTLLGKLAILSNLSGTEKERLGLLNLSLSASYSQFALLGHGRNISLIVADLIDRLGNCQDDAEVRNLLQEKSPGILDILGQLGTTTWNKGKLLGAQLKVTTHRPTRLAMQNEQMLMHTLSEDIDAILDLLEPIS
jgi:hypothetical protein